MAVGIFGGATQGLGLLTKVLQQFNEEQVRSKHTAAAMKVAITEATIASEKMALKQLKVIGATPGELATQRAAIKGLKETLVGQKEALSLQQGLLAVHEAIGDSAKIQISILGPALLYTYRTILSYSVKINEAVQQANTNYTKRYAILEANLQVVRETGVAVNATAEASKALVDYRLEDSGHLRNNLGLMTKLNVALGVQYDTSAKLAAVYERQLGRSMNNVADTVARIAAETAIAAQKAAEYAFQVARALRILGPGGIRTESERVTEVVAQLAGRVQEMGGEADNVIQLFQRLTSGSAEGLWLRGRAGVNLGAMRTGEGATEALRGVVDSMRQYINANRELQPELYAAQLHSVGEAFGFTSDQAFDLMEAVDALNKPLNTQQTLEKAFREQQQLTAQSVDQLMNALHALLAQAVTPLYRALRPVIDAITTAVRWLADSPVSLWTVFGLVSAAGLVTIKVLYGVAARLLLVARNGAIGQIISPGGRVGKAIKGVGGGAALLGGRVGKAIKGVGGGAALLGGRVGKAVKGVGGGAALLGGGVGRIGTSLASLIPQIMRIGAPALIAAAASVGWGFGTWLRKVVPSIDEVLQVLLRWFGMYKQDKRAPLKVLGGGEGSAITWLARAAEAGARGQIGNMTEAMKMAARFEGVTAENMQGWMEVGMEKAWATYQLQQRYTRFAMSDAESVAVEKAMYRAMVAAQEYLRVPENIERVAKHGELSRQLANGEAERKERERQGNAAQTMHQMLEAASRSAPAPGYDFGSLTRDMQY
jgi:hypothetical protein